MKQTRSNKRLPTTLTEAEVEALLAQVNPRSTTGLRNRAMLAAMLGAGLRVSEIVALVPRDVDLEEGMIRVNNGKGGRDRVVPVDQETAGWLRAWAEKRIVLGLNGRRRFFCAVRRTQFGSEPGKPITVRTVQALVTRLARAAGMEKQVTPHVLRHTYATRLLDGGFTIREVQELLGHSSVHTTMIYTHVNPAALRKKIQGPKQNDLQARISAMEEQLADLKRTADLT